MYVKKICDDIIAFKPDVVVTEKGLSELACHHFVKVCVCVAVCVVLCVCQCVWCCVCVCVCCVVCVSVSV